MRSVTFRFFSKSIATHFRRVRWNSRVFLANHWNQTSLPALLTIDTLREKTVNMILFEKTCKFTLRIAYNIYKNKIHIPFDKIPFFFSSLSLVLDSYASMPYNLTLFLTKTENLNHKPVKKMFFINYCMLCCTKTCFI